MKKFFGLIVIAIMLFIVTEVTAQKPKEHYVIIAPDKPSMELARYTVTKLNLDTLAKANSSIKDSSVSVMLVFNIDNFWVKDDQDGETQVIVASVEIQILPEIPAYVPVGDVVIGLLNTQADRDKFVNDTRDKINVLINNYLKNVVAKEHK